MKTKILLILLSAGVTATAVFTACDSDDDKAPSASPYISKVFEYRPAPGQFVNELPMFEMGDTEESIRLKAEKSIANNKKEMVTLGGFGGYVVFGFDHMVKNENGKCDFRVSGNAFWGAGSSTGGSSEPGVIMVAYDANGNGKPDANEWYEIAGSEHNKPATVKNYEITYHRPNPSKTPVVDENIEPTATDVEYIQWEDNQSNSGYLYKLRPHPQNYYPNWINQDEMTFTGTKLPNNAEDKGATDPDTGEYVQQWVLTAFQYGYADNIPNNDNRSAIDINWAVDSDGNPVSLPGIHFVKVYSGLNQQCGWIGETSTEVSGAEDLHLLGVNIASPF
ncbi:PKD domain-containing protein [Dysgonomonas sp. 25]|uniref:PKD domain-containing protein n=1 Tax=Dysgonomonas sp. 25 TaxID=2302933 RepID=UPI0013D23A28|nr:PKD domain-containing protein [Dysgonomonas sp. 25]NDV67636.1 PKD domain-containing protein [Dysgonomonas sp. 25]